MGGIRDDSPPVETTVRLLQPDAGQQYEEEHEGLEILGEVGSDDDWIMHKIQQTGAAEDEEPDEENYITNEQLLTAEDAESVEFVKSWIKKEKPAEANSVKPVDDHDGIPDDEIF
jgi:hypothetical protein